MPSSGMLCRVTRVRTDVSEEHITSIIRVFLRGVVLLLVTASVVPSSPIFVTLMMDAIHSPWILVRKRGIPASRNYRLLLVLLLLLLLKF
jgi:hypothetical protein